MHGAGLGPGQGQAGKASSGVLFLEFLSGDRRGDRLTTGALGPEGTF